MKLPIALCAMLLATPAQAHEWYPLECCSGVDCAPVEKVEVAPLPTADENASGSPPSIMKITTKHGTAILPANLTRRESKDNRMHACISCNSGGWPVCRVRCVFFPPGM